MADPVHRRSLRCAAALTFPVTMLLLGMAAGPHSSTLKIVVQSSSASASSDCPWVTQAKIVQGTTPILFVHGINSKPTMWTNEAQVDGTADSPLQYVQKSLGNAKVTAYTFDWSFASGSIESKDVKRPVMWVTDPLSPDLGMRLAQAIGCIAHRAGHKVIIIAHSMGGLIAKYASNLDSTDIAAVFTMGTPYQGSWLASAAVGKDPDRVHEFFVQAISTACAIRFPSTTQQPPKRHPKPSGTIAKATGAVAAWCDWVNALMSERNDSGVMAMRLDGGPNGGWKDKKLSSWPTDLSVYPLAGSIQVTWQPVWPLNIQVPVEDFGDGAVGTSSQLASPDKTASCPVRLGVGSSLGTPAALSLLDALGTSPCIHLHEPYNKTLLDDIVSQARQMLPTAKVDWYNMNYTMTCGGLAPQPFTISMQNGKATAPVNSGGYSRYEVGVEAVTRPGDLSSDGSPQTAVVLYCSPQPSNFFVEEVQVFKSDGTLLGELPPTNTLSPGSALPPQYDSSQFSISGGQLITGMKFYAPTDSHASGPSIHQVVKWTWDGHKFTHDPFTLPQARPSPSCPAVGAGVPAGLASAVEQQIGKLCGVEIGQVKVDTREPSWVTFLISPTPGSTVQGGGGIAHEVNGTWPVVLTGSSQYWCDPRVPPQVDADFGLSCPSGT
jgi:pimeloyl-ACP methyl ester carboxylesterase